MKKHFFVLGLCVLPQLAALAADPKKVPLPVPLNIRVSDSKTRGIIWDKLTHQEQKLAFHLIEASRAGRDILFFHNHRNAPAIKQLLETALSARNIADTKALLGADAFKELVSYAAKFEDLAGPYEGSNRKYVLRATTRAQVENLFKIFAGSLDAKTTADSIALMTDADYEVIQFPEDAAGTELEAAGGNFYEKGVSGKEVEQALKEGLASCLNCRIVRSPTGGLRVEVQTVKTPGIVGQALARVVRELRLAVPYATTPGQRAQLEHLIKFFEEGDVEDFRQANIDWVRDGTKSKVDFMMGFVEVYQDYKAQIGSWESYVQIIDPATTQTSVRLAQNAQYFEDAMPYGKFKETFPRDYAPPALMVYYFQEISSMHSGGYNLPNFDDIRRDVGAKNIIRLGLPGEKESPALQKIRREYLEEFLPAALVDRALANMDASWQTLVLLHEIIGHGSGTYDTSKYGEKEDPVGALGSLGSALEEQRADLTALVFAADPKLVDVGIYKTQEEANAVRDVMYDTYLADFLRHTSKERTLTEAHQRGNWLLVNLLIESGAAGWVAKDGSSAQTPENGVLAVKDYAKFHDVAVGLLAELQRIKAVRDEAALKTLFEQKAPLDAIHLPWAQAIVKRGERLAVNSGAIEQPWRVSRKGEFKTLCETLLLEDAAQQWHRQ
ncbi:MAG: hypothetical protein HY075_12120 [Deltaproteobacteria bacterium]|nr:hypothetical protein [Deltaproteobacteria bacterium]